MASLLTLALHDDLPYLTQVMEQLLVSLMEQPSNAQPKLLLRRTESIVEKLLTNWMSVCLYGFLRVSLDLCFSRSDLHTVYTHMEKVCTFHACSFFLCSLQ